MAIFHAYLGPIHSALGSPLRTSWRNRIAVTGIILFILAWLSFMLFMLLVMSIGDPQFSKIENGKYLMTRHPNNGYYEVSAWLYHAMNWFSLYAHTMHALGLVGFGMFFFAKRRSSVFTDKEGSLKDRFE